MHAKGKPVAGNGALFSTQVQVPLLVPKSDLVDLIRSYLPSKAACTLLFKVFPLAEDGPKEAPEEGGFVRLIVESGGRGSVRQGKDVQMQMQMQPTPDEKANANANFRYARRGFARVAYGVLRTAYCVLPVVCVLQRPRRRPLQACSGQCSCSTPHG